MTRWPEMMTFAVKDHVSFAEPSVMRLARTRSEKLCYRLNVSAAAAALETCYIISTLKFPYQHRLGVAYNFSSSEARLNRLYERKIVS